MCQKGCGSSTPQVYGSKTKNKITIYHLFFFSPHLYFSPQLPATPPHFFFFHAVFLSCVHAFSFPQWSLLSFSLTFFAPFFLFYSPQFFIFPFSILPSTQPFISPSNHPIFSSTPSILPSFSQTLPGPFKHCISCMQMQMSCFKSISYILQWSSGSSYSKSLPTHIFSFSLFFLLNLPPIQFSPTSQLCSIT